MKSLRLTFLLLFVSVCFYGQEAVELEGFYKVNGDEHMFYPLRGKEVNAPVLLEVKENQIPQNIINTALVKVKGNMVKKYFTGHERIYFYKIEVSSITIKDNNLLLENYLKSHRYDQLPKLNNDDEEGRVVYFEEEGYYLGAFEGQNFRILKNNEFEDMGLVPIFDNKVTDSILKVNEFYLASRSTSFKQGVYMKISGLRVYGKYQGRYIGLNSHLSISRILEIDISKTYWEFIERKIREKGFYEYNSEKLTFPNILQEGKIYTLMTKEVCDCMLEAKRTGGYIDYTFTEKEDTGIKSRFSGRLIANPWTYNKEPSDTEIPGFNYQVTYESVATESQIYLYYYSKFTVQVHREKDENGNIYIVIEDHINDREFGLTEVKN